MVHGHQLKFLKQPSGGPRQAAMRLVIRQLEQCSDVPRVGVGGERGWRRGGGLRFRGTVYRGSVAIDRADQFSGAQGSHQFDQVPLEGCDAPLAKLALYGFVHCQCKCADDVTWLSLPTRHQIVLAAHV